MKTYIYPNWIAEGSDNMFYVSLKNQQIKVRNMGRMDAYFVTVQCGQIQFMLKELASRYAVHFSVTDNVHTAEVLAVAGKNVITQEFERESTGKFTERIKQIIPKETIVQMLFEDLYSLDAPEAHRLYTKHDLMAPFIELMFVECDTLYREGTEEKEEFANFLYEQYGIRFEQGDGSSEILIAKCLTAMTYLQLSKEEIGRHFMKVLRV